MEYVSLGRTGLKVSRLCLGCMNFGGASDKETSFAIMQAALDAGIIFWDTANVYNDGRSEELVGEFLAERKCRDQVVLATKVYSRVGPGPNDAGLSRRHILQQVDASLRRLRTDWIDLYQLHRPDPETPMEETVEAMDACVRAGKVRYWGTSTFAAWQMAEMWWYARSAGLARPVCEQAPYNIVDRRLENERLSFIRQYGWGLITWSPLAGGLLAGRYTLADLESPPPDTRLARSEIYRARVTPAAIRVYEAVAALAAEVGCSPAGFAIAWLLHQPGVTAPIIGPRTVAHLKDYLSALEVRLSSDVLERVDQLVPPGTAVADFHNTARWFVGTAAVQ